MNLYHYCSTKKCFSILESKTLRMSDVAKSNDYSELELFFPQILWELRKEYIHNPFSFKFENLYDFAAFDYLLDDTYEYWKYRFGSGEFSNLMVCFSSVEDSLSQWRGYADNGKGCCMVFSKDAIKRYCRKSKGLLRFEKITYLTDSQIDDLVKNTAKSILQSLRVFVLENDYNTIPNDPDHDFDIMLINHLDKILGEFFIDSLKYKSQAFYEEDEWRIFMTHTTQQHRELIKYGRNFSQSKNNIELKNETNDDICFRISDDDIIPFYPIYLDELGKHSFIGIILGPKNHIRTSDIKLYLQQHGYGNIIIEHSQITYR